MVMATLHTFTKKPEIQPSCI